MLIRATSTAICGTDLHFHEGRMRGIEGGILGHEPLDLVLKVGSGVKKVRKGDRVTVPPPHLLRFLRDVRRRPYLRVPDDPSAHGRRKLRDMILTGAAKPS